MGEMAPRVKCRKCSAMILEITASTNGGYCGMCAKKRGMRYRLGQVKAVIEFLGVTLVLPFVALWCGIRIAWRRWRFPFDRAALLASIREVYKDVDIAWSYLDGVVDGYWESAPENQAMFTSNRARLYGTEDGGRLRRGEITISDIPTHKLPWLRAVKLPNVRCSRG